MLSKKGFIRIILLNFKFLVALDLLNFQVSLIEEQQWNLEDSSNGNLLEESVHDLQSLRSELSNQLENSVDKLLIHPLTEYQLLLEKVDSIIKKRNNKLLDYDRNRIGYEKMTSNPAKRNEMSEEKKILKVILYNAKQCLWLNLQFTNCLFCFLARATFESSYPRIRSL